MNAAPISALHDDALLSYRIAGSSRDAPRRLLILAHGVGGDETNLAALAQYAEKDTRVILPRAPIELGPGQYGWFQVSFDERGPRPDLAAAERSRQELAAFVAQMQQRHGVAPERTVVAGFSQGGILSASVGLTRPELVRGFGVLAGRILPQIEPLLAPRDALARIEAFLGHGRDDAKLGVDWAHRADAWLGELGVVHETRLYPAGHEIPSAMREDFFAWLQRLIPASRPVT